MTSFVVVGLGATRASLKVISYAISFVKLVKL